VGQFSVFSFQFSVFSFQFSVFGFRFSVFGSHDTARSAGKSDTPVPTQPSRLITAN
jgi:hypothetical protein